MYEITENDINYCDAMVRRMCDLRGDDVTEDHIQEGRLGMVIAAQKYDPDKGFRFMSYAIHWIRARLTTMHTSRHVCGAPYKGCVYYQNLQVNTQRETSDDCRVGKECEDRQIIQKALEELPENLRVAVVDKALRDKPISDTSREYGLNPRSLSSMLLQWRKEKGYKIEEG